MSDPSPLAVPCPLPLGLTDSHAFIHQPRFHKTTSFRPSHAPTQDHFISYAVSGSTDPSAPWVVWLNGMGGHRLAGTFLDGLAAERGLRVVTFDRPGAGRSTRVPLRYRVEASYEALLAVLEAEGIKEFGLFTHSNVSPTSEAGPGRAPVAHPFEPARKLTLSLNPSMHIILHPHRASYTPSTPSPASPSPTSASPPGPSQPPG